MGLSSSKQTQTSSYTPSAQQVQAGNALNTAFQQQMPRVQGYADQVGALIPGMIERYQAGNPGVNAAQNWITSTLGNNGQNPFLDQMIQRSGSDMADGLNSKLGTRGNIGGSVQSRILADALAKNSLGYRYNDYNANRQLQAQAAGMAPSNAAAEVIQISPLLAASGYAGGAPMQAASQYASGMGGLFGNAGTTTNTTTQSPGLFGMLVNGLSSAARAYAGGV